MKIAIVSGASGNLGQSVTSALINKGYKVIGTVIPNDPVEIRFPPQQFEKAVVDLLNEHDSLQFIESVIAKYRTIDLAVLTVGGFALGKISDTSTSEIARQYRLNFETTYNLARPIFGQMLKQNSGRIFMIGSKPGLNAKNGHGMVAYGLAKSLVFRLAEFLNDEAKGMNVVTSVIIPSTIDTPQNRKAMPKAKFDHWVTPDQIAEIILFYSSEAGSVLREPVIKVYNNS